MGGSGGGSRTFGRPSEPEPPPTPTDSLGGGGGGSGSRPDPCEGLDVTAVLQSPQAGVVPGLRKGDALGLRLSGGGVPVVAVDQSGRTAGSIVIRDMATLLNCMKAGRRFIAEVLQVSGGAVTVRVHAEGV